MSMEIQGLRIEHLEKGSMLAAGVWSQVRRIDMGTRHTGHISSTINRSSKSIASHPRCVGAWRRTDLNCAALPTDKRRRSLDAEASHRPHQRRRPSHHGVAGSMGTPLVLDATVQDAKSELTSTSLRMTALSHEPMPHAMLGLAGRAAFSDADPSGLERRYWLKLTLLGQPPQSRFALLNANLLHTSILVELN